MAEDITCFACEQDPTQQCPRCGRPYCDQHGEEVCDACLEPAGGLPSFTLYRGSLLALLIGTALAVWLILQPPGQSVDSAVGPTVITPTPPVSVQSTPAQQASPPVGTTPAVQQTPLTQPTATPAPEQTPGVGGGGTITYTVQAGDSLSAICGANSSLGVAECVERTMELNSISDPASISIGETLVIPQ